jgi:hypothetical protein
MNYFLGLILTILMSSPAFADSTVFDCKVSKILDDSVFEESLSKDEYPDVYLVRMTDGALELNAGAMLDWTTRRRDQVQLIANDEAIVVKARRRIDHYYESSFVKVEVAKKLDSKSRRLGLLWATRNKSSKIIKVAQLICK